MSDKPQILTDLIEKCKTASLNNRGMYPPIAATEVVSAETGVSIQETIDENTPHLNITEAVLYAGSSKVTLEVLAAPDGATFTWESSDTAIATVTKAGVVTRKKVGKCKVTATAGDLVLTATIICKAAAGTVNDIPYATINECVAAAQKANSYIVPLAATTYTFQKLGESVKVKNNGIKVTFKAIPNTETTTYKVTEEAIGSAIIYTCAEAGEPEYELTSNKGVVTYGASLSGYKNTSGIYKLLKDVTLSKTIYFDCGVLGGDIVLDLNGHTITADKDTSLYNKNTYCVIDVNRANVLVKNGKVIATEDSNGIKGIGNWSAKTVTIENVEVKGHVECLYIQKGTTIVNGGEFSIYPYEDGGDPYRFTLNCLDANYKAGTANFQVNAGKFYKYNPADSASENPHANFVTDGHTSTVDGDYFVVA